MVYGVRSRKFCCCLPVRFGVFVMTLIGLLGGGAVAIGSWYGLAHQDTQVAARVDRTTLEVSAGIYTFLALICLFGLIGCIFRRRTLVRWYLFVLTAQFFLSVGFGIWSLVEFFRYSKAEWQDECLNGIADNTMTQDAEEDLCRKAYNTARWTLPVVYIIAWVIELYGLIIVDNYVDQISDERRAKNTRYVPLDESKVGLVSGSHA
ncbi:hypothetical protein BD626DRAFT_131627 [Schizophyllum amplum]|uniref:Tetraspanin family-domain-containing protein n=1 Tax=Schizophyllum amplum TaxID=97359 RepID=A0A550C6F6_9AGAR|nr:hypothetical protein BD626DRAFT_131627 [Auriculariopsis ampla]